MAVNEVHLKRAESEDFSRYHDTQTLLGLANKGRPGESRRGVIGDWIRFTN